MDWAGKWLKTFWSLSNILEEQLKYRHFWTFFLVSGISLARKRFVGLLYLQKKINSETINMYVLRMILHWNVQIINLCIFWFVKVFCDKKSSSVDLIITYNLANFFDVQNIPPKLLLQLKSVTKFKETSIL